MKFTNLPVIELPAFMKDAAAHNASCYLNIILPEDDSVIIARGRDGDIKWVPENGIVIESDHVGGSLVGFKDGISLVAFAKEEPSWQADLLKLLQSRGLNAEIKGNDIIVDKFYKVSGCMRRGFTDDLNFYGIHIPMNMDVNLVKKICSKPMTKIPRGLSSWGLTRQQVLRALNVE